MGGKGIELSWHFRNHDHWMNNQARIYIVQGHISHVLRQTTSLCHLQQEIITFILQECPIDEIRYLNQNSKKYTLVPHLVLTHSVLIHCSASSRPVPFPHTETSALAVSCCAWKLSVRYLLSTAASPAMSPWLRVESCCWVGRGV